MTDNRVGKELVFDLEPAAIPVRIGTRSYVLHEATAGDGMRYRNEIMDRVETNEQGKVVKTHNIGDVEPMLVSLCLRTSDGEPVSLNDVLAMPSRVVRSLFTEAKKVSGLDETDDEETLVKQIADAQEKLSQIRKGKAADPTTV